MPRDRVIVIFFCVFCEHFQQQEVVVEVCHILTRWNDDCGSVAPDVACGAVPAADSASVVGLSRGPCLLSESHIQGYSSCCKKHCITGTDHNHVARHAFKLRP